MNSLLPPDSIFGITAVLTAIAALTLWLEARGIGRRLSAAVMAILGGMLFANLRILPFASPVYDFIWSHVLLFGLVVLLLQADLRRICRETGRVMLAFLLGALGTVIGAFVAFAVCFRMPHAAELSGVFAASYTGGSINFLATSRALGMDAYPDIQAGALAADNLVMACYFVLLFALPEIGFLKHRFGERARRMEIGSPVSDGGRSAEVAIRPVDFTAIFALAAGVCLVGRLAAWVTPFAGAAVLWTTAFAVLLATVMSGPLRRLRGTQSLGLALMQVFFVVIGAGASIGAVIRIGPVVVLFLSVILLIHLTVLLAGGWLLRFDLRELAGASNANCGGPTTAAAMAVAKDWRALTVPLILCGTFGYGIANFIGVAVARLLGAG